MPGRSRQRPRSSSAVTMAGRLRGAVNVQLAAAADRGALVVAGHAGAQHDVLGEPKLDAVGRLVAAAACRRTVAIVLYLPLRRRFWICSLLTVACGLDRRRTGARACRRAASVSACLERDLQRLPRRATARPVPDRPIQEGWCSRHHLAPLRAARHPAGGSRRGCRRGARARVPACRGAVLAADEGEMPAVLKVRETSSWSVVGSAAAVAAVVELHVVVPPRSSR